MSIIGLVLLQQGKGADMGASFGGGGSQKLFGAAGGGNVLTRATAVLAATFFVTSFGLAIIAKQKAGEVSSDELLLPESEIVVVEEPASEAESGIEAHLDALEASGQKPLSSDEVPLDIVDSIPQ
ncbi:MAG: preprotein translocase subunit SecG [Pseudomonadales bacterium]|nr:preprotein translocase subunit SecG [Pseudomonadales bacterium]